jgi:uncharacterized protein YoxC
MMQSKSLWEYCHVENDSSSALDELQSQLNSSTPADVANPDMDGAEPEGEDETVVQNQHTILKLQKYLEESQQSCNSALEYLDNLLTTIHSVKQSYYDVTGRTNSLMAKCENLLEEQHNLQNTVEILNKTLKPFQDIEDVAQMLGIPYESIHHPNASNNNNSLLSPAPTPSTSRKNNNNSQNDFITNLDPRSPEFKEMLLKLSSAVVFLHEHKDIMENSKYYQWLEKLQIRAISLIGRSMRELIDKTAKQCRDIIQQKLYSFNPSASSSASASSSSSTALSASSSANSHHQQDSRYYSDEQPLESLPVYQKFRGLSFRMKELVTILLKGNLLTPVVSSGNTDNESTTTFSSSSVSQKALFNHLLKHDYAILAEVKKSYSLIRMELLQSLLQEAFIVSLSAANRYATATPTGTLHPTHSGTNFSNIIEEKRSSLSSTTPTHQSKGLQDNASSSSTTTSSHLSLSTVIRHSFSTLLRICQLEYQLFDSLFNIDPSSKYLQQQQGGGGKSLSLKSPSLDSSSSTQPTPRSGKQHSTAMDAGSQFANDLIRVIEFLSNSTRDFLRPLIIRESSVDELCRVITALSEDIKSQIVILMIPSILVKQLNQGLDNILNDSKERLIYCSENKLRQEIQFYEPLPSHLQYPEILENYEKKLKATTPVPSSSSSSSTQEVYETWYPPLRFSLSLLSKLYGIIDMTIFEHFARRCIEICVSSLIHGSEQIKRKDTQNLIHGDLFLVRHLLILREQLIPFEIKLVSTEKHMDFTNTKLVFQQLMSTPAGQQRTPLALTNGNEQSPNALTSPTTAASSSSLLNNLFLRFDENNLFFRFAQSGVPTMKELSHDMKKELDNSLKKACFSLKVTAVKIVLGPLDGLLAKISAFIGEIPYQTTTSASTAITTPHAVENGSEGQSPTAHPHNVPVLPKEHIQLLKSQKFAGYDRFKECLVELQKLPWPGKRTDLRAFMQVNKVLFVFYFSSDLVVINLF